MIGDEFVQIPPAVQQHVLRHPIESGLSDWLTVNLAEFEYVETVHYTSYVDVMGTQAQPMLVAIVTGQRLLPEEYDEPIWEVDEEAFLLTDEAA